MKKWVSKQQQQAREWKTARGKKPAGGQDPEENKYNDNNNPGKMLKKTMKLIRLKV